MNVSSTPPIDFVWNDGGRSAAGYKGATGDCVVRSVAIAMERDYASVYNDMKRLLVLASDHRVKQGKDAGIRSPRHGVPIPVLKPYMKALGWHWIPSMGIGTGCRIHLRQNELPHGRLIVRLSGHMAAVIDGTVHDTYDCSRDGTRCVYGFFAHPDDAEEIRMFVDRMVRA